jgi:hypothetical protein
MPPQELSLYSYEVTLSINGTYTRIGINHHKGPEGMDEDEYNALAEEAREHMIDAFRYADIQGMRYTGLKTVSIDMDFEVDRAQERELEQIEAVKETQALHRLYQQQQGLRQS